MDSTREREIRDRVRNEIHVELWNQRAELYGRSGIDIADLLPIDLQLVARMKSLTVFEQDEILLDHPVSSAAWETAGYLDRDLGVIEISLKFPHRCRRFTLAHEIAHYFLHTDLRQHRDLPLIGSERELAGRPRKEQEADIFASELLMPEKPTRKVFLLAYRTNMISANSATDELAFDLSRGTGRPVTIQEFSAPAARRYRSRLLAETGYIRGNMVKPLCDIFDVSPAALAIRFEELGLVI